MEGKQRDREREQGGGGGGGREDQGTNKHTEKRIWWRSGRSEKTTRQTNRSGSRPSVHFIPQESPAASVTKFPASELKHRREDGRLSDWMRNSVSARLYIPFLLGYSYYRNYCKICLWTNEGEKEKYISRNSHRWFWHISARFRLAQRRRSIAAYGSNLRAWTGRGSGRRGKY